MAFRIIFNGKNYPPKEFINIPCQIPSILKAQEFILNWESDTDFVFSSSGSTGSPRMYEFKKWQLEISANATINALHLQKQMEHILLCIDAKFVGGAMMLARAILLDSPITLFEPRGNIFEKIDVNNDYTFASFVPLQLTNECFSMEKFNRIGTVLIGGSGISISLEKQLRNSSNKVFQSYGMTETLSHVALKDIQNLKGYKVIEPYKVSINEEDCICIEAPFLNNTLITNDIGCLLDDDSFDVLGRTDFVINSGGIKIFPEQLERIISEMSNQILRKSFFVGKAKHEIFGEEVTLVCQERITELDFDTIKNHLFNEGLKKEAPRRILFLSEFPLTESGRINRNKLNEWIDNQ
jgi:O-succinylbenzoic acid--CoA ligase